MMPNMMPVLKRSKQFESLEMSPRRECIEESVYERGRRSSGSSGGGDLIDAESAGEQSGWNRTEREERAMDMGIRGR